MRRYKLESKEFSEINITPFTDVVLVLLIIFMIASPFLVTGAMKVKLPQASTSENVVKKNVEIFVDANNNITVDDVKIPENQLEQVLKVKY
jgi:biopolymer transport protein ExbD